MDIKDEVPAAGLCTPESNSKDQMAPLENEEGAKIETNSGKRHNKSKGDQPTQKQKDVQHKDANADTDPHYEVSDNANALSISKGDQPTQKHNKKNALLKDANADTKLHSEGSDNANAMSIFNFASSPLQDAPASRRTRRSAAVEAKKQQLADLNTSWGVAGGASSSTTEEEKCMSCRKTGRRRSRVRLVSPQSQESSGDNKESVLEIQEDSRDTSAVFDQGISDTEETTGSAGATKRSQRAAAASKQKAKTGCQPKEAEGAYEKESSESDLAKSKVMKKEKSSQEKNEYSSGTERKARKVSDKKLNDERSEAAYTDSNMGSSAGVKNSVDKSLMSPPSTGPNRRSKSRTRGASTERVPPGGKSRHHEEPSGIGKRMKSSNQDDPTGGSETLMSPASTGPKRRGKAGSQETPPGVPPRKQRASYPPGK